ncbi:MAG: NAD-dependent epimerase/dehydratase family protein [Dehalococcoidia bacterium]
MATHSLDQTFWNNRRVTVGGGCGLIGSYLVPLLVDAGARVTVIDNLQNGVRENIAPVADRITFIEGDLRERRDCRQWLTDQDLFLNLAARASGVGFSRTHHATMLMDNLASCVVPLDVARECGVSHAVVISSSCVYDDSVPVPTPEIGAFEGWPERVNEGYGWAKRIEELAASYLRAETGMQVTVLRPFNVYGGNYPWHSGERAHVIPSLVKRVLDGEDPLVVWGSGEQRRNFLHGADAAFAMLKVVEAGPGDPVNIGYEDDTRIADLVNLVCDVTGRSPRIVFDRSKPDGQARKSADATRLRALTGGYEPRISLREGIEDMVRWYARRFGPAHP